VQIRIKDPSKLRFTSEKKSWLIIEQFKIFDGCMIDPSINEQKRPPDLYITTSGKGKKNFDRKFDDSGTS